MHPEVRRIGPGGCPICGMALEPLLVTAGTGENLELGDMTRRFWVDPAAHGSGNRPGDGGLCWCCLAKPVDGEITEGKGTVDESMVSGEPIPVSKAPAPKSPLER